MPDREIIDRVAKAMEYKIASLNRLKPVDWSIVAMAAIKAMREPTEKMIKVGNKYTDWASGADDAWSAMIDAILND